MGKKITALVVALIIALVSLSLLELGFNFYSGSNSRLAEEETFAQKAERTEAEVVSFRQKTQMTSEGTRVHKSFVVTYTVEGKVYKEELGYHEEMLQVGDKLEILYNPENPTQIAYPKANLTDVTFKARGKRLITMGAIGLTVGVIGLVVTAVMLYRGSRKKPIR